MTVAERSLLMAPVEENLVELSEIMASRVGSVNPKSFLDEKFELFSIPAFDKGSAEIETGNAIGSSKQNVLPGDVLLSKIVPHIRRSWIVTPNRGHRQIASGEWIIFRDKRIHGPYLRQVLVSDIFNAQFMQTVAGVGGSLLRARPAHVAKIRIPLPPLPEQRRIAAILDKADNLRTQRREALSHLHALERSIFDSMFSAPLGTWTETRLDAVANVSSGITKGRKTNSQALRTFPYLAVSNVQDRNLDMSVVKEIEVTPTEAERFRLQKGDLLMTEGGDPDKLGRGTVWNDELPWCLHQNHVFRVRIADNETVIPIFLSWFLSSPESKGYFLRMAKQTTGIASINKTQLSATPLTVPPLELQQTFARRVGGVERLKEQHSTQLAQLDALFASLQYRAFKGEL